MIESFKLNSEDLKKETYLALLMSGRSLSIPAAGGSMSPVLKKGDLITIKYVSIENIRIGDIVAYKRQGQSNTMVHRLVKKGMHNGKMYLVTKGDANLRFSCDPSILAGDILGKVISRQRNGRMLDLDGYFAHIFGYILARFLFYCPWLLRVLKKIVRTFRRLWRIVLKRHDLRYRDRKLKQEIYSG